MWKYYLAIIVIGLYGCKADMRVPDRSELVGSWMVEYIGERPVIDRSPAFIEFSVDDMVGGNASCNRFTSSYTLSEAQLSFGQAAVTRMACPEALMEQEQRFLASLSQVAQVQLENGILELTDADGTLVFKASRRETTE